MAVKLSSQEARNAYVASLKAAPAIVPSTEPLIDPDCRDEFKHATCVGGPCECPCHGVPLSAYRGTNERGTFVGGVFGERENIAEAIRARFDRGWRRLTVARDGVEVGGIGVLDGRRRWWAAP